MTGGCVSLHDIAKRVNVLAASSRCKGCVDVLFGELIKVQRAEGEEKVGARSFSMMEELGPKHPTFDCPATTRQTKSSLE
jgi:hypothetical protein